jgi:hypothetical protein
LATAVEGAYVAAMFMIRYFVNMAVRHKHLKLEQSKLDRAKRLLGVKTEQETVERALDVLLAEEPILRAHRRLKGVGGFVDVFGRAR